jgi:CBS domain-containing protein
MLIEHILATKGPEVVHTPSTTTVADAVAQLKAFRIGAVVVSDDEGATAAGILSERDVVRALAEEGAAVLQRWPR